MDELINHLLGSQTAESWEKIGIFPHHGINIPLSALHTKRSIGIGEYFDLIPLIDWCQQLKLDVIQLLPLNHSEHDPSPYNSCSSCALNPLNLSLYELPHLDRHPQLIEELDNFLELPLPSRIDFAEVRSFKLKWLHAYFEAEGRTLIKRKAVQHFITENPWVETYALYESLKNQLGSTPWTTWPSEFKNPTKQEYLALIKLHFPDIARIIAIQYLCYEQLSKVKAYANERGVFLMGDIPILLSTESADVWSNPELFDIHFQAGAPPDLYNPEGQCWGFPLYRWDVLRKTHFKWWKQRLSYASHFYDIYRIDHVIGLFRIWAIAHEKSGKDGSFLPSDPKSWEPQGREILQTFVESCSMLPIAEDLGDVPECVPPILKEMGICGTKVMRWQRNWEEEARFIPIQYYPPISLTTVSTHDSEPLQLWWKTFPEEAQTLAQSKHWEYSPDLSMFQHKEILWDSHHTPSLFHINPLQEYLALFPELVASNPEDERINIPGKLLATNWTYRFRPSVEEIIAHEELAKAIEKVVHSPDALSL